MFIEGKEQGFLNLFREKFPLSVSYLTLSEDDVHSADVEKYKKRVL